MEQSTQHLHTALRARAQDMIIIVIIIIINIIININIIIIIIIIINIIIIITIILEQSTLYLQTALRGRAPKFMIFTTTITMIIVPSLPYGSAGAGLQAIEGTCTEGLQHK